MRFRDVALLFVQFVKFVFVRAKIDSSVTC